MFIVTVKGALHNIFDQLENSVNNRKRNSEAQLFMHSAVFSQLWLRGKAFYDRISILVHTWHRIKQQVILCSTNW